MGRVSICIYCEILVFRNRPICRTCEELLQKRMSLDFENTNPRQSQGVPLKFLVGWKKDRDPELSRLLSSLKGGQRAGLWDLAAQAFLSKHLLESMKYLQGTYLFPVPSKRGISEDHAYNWGKALSLHLGLPMFLGTHLEKEHPGVSIKHLSRGRRLSKNQIWSFAVPSDCKRVIIVDDIVTTGSTLRSIVRAHDLPGLEWEAWALAYRISS